MAFTLQIKAKGLFGNKKLDMEALLSNCNLRFGSDNEFFVLEEGKTNQGTCILYNPQRIGRGIFFDASKMGDGQYVLSYNIPTTEAEITDFIRVAKEIERQSKHVEMYCVEEERSFTVESLMENKERMVQFSLDTLNQFCGNKEYKSYIFTLAMWPLVLTKEQVAYYATCRDLKEFEQLLHDKQNLDVYYAKPTLLHNNNTGKNGAFYTLTEECESIFPIRADGFINMDNVKIDEGFVRFFIYSENRVLDGLFDYDRFVKALLDRGATYFDEEHIRVPSMIKQQILEIAEEIAVV